MPVDLASAMDRRTVLVAGCAGCAALVAGCGGGDDDAATSPSTSSSSSSSSAAAPSSSSSSAAASTGLAAMADLTVGTPVAATADGTKIIIVKTSDTEVVAFDARCPHQGCTVAPEGTQLACPCHGSMFSADGAVLNGPAQDDLSPFSVTVTDGNVVAA